MEQIIEERLREVNNIDEMQFGISLWKGTDEVFAVEHFQEKYMEKQKNLYFTFVDLENVYDRVLREIIYWCLPEKRSDLLKFKDNSRNCTWAN